MHRVDREDITIIILDTKLVPDRGQSSYSMLLRSANKSISDENRAAKSLFVSDPGSEIFFLITSEIRPFHLFHLLSKH